MTESKAIKIFLASSITELEKERQDISDSISQDMTNLFEKDNIIIQFLRCDSIHSGNIGMPDQDRIDNMLRKCDISLFLFKDKEGDYTLHEYEVARKLQKDKKHEIFVYYLHGSEQKSSEKLTAFKERLKTDGVYWKVYNNLMEMKYDFSMGLLKHLDVQLGASIQSTEEVKKDGDALFEQLEQNKLQMHQEIEKLLEKIAPVMEAEDSSIAAKITQVIGIYQKADLWASKTDYDREKYADLLFDYAQFLYRYGLYRDSEAVYLRQIALAEELYGIKHENIAGSYNNIGLVYWKQGNYPKALEYYFKALEIDEKVLGKDHPGTATDYNNIGEVYRSQGDYIKALEYYFKALEIREKKLGKGHSDTAESYNNIGAVYKAQGDYHKALENYFKALEIFEKVLGKDHPNTASSYNNIGAVYDDQDDYPKALEYYFKALEIDEKVLGKDHPDTAGDYTNIGSLYYEQGNYPKALEYLNKAMEIFEKKLGPNHPNTQTVKKWIDLVHEAMGESPTDRSFFQRLKAFFK